jgi:hypothetical protein
LAGEKLIDSYDFGNIKVDGQGYHSDIIIFPNHVKSDWWRKDGHLLQIEDLEDVLNEKPNTIIIGTGAYGVMKVPESVIKHLKDKNINVIIQKTYEAVKTYNNSPLKGKVVAALHLTC